ncbi:MAG: sulfatase family protein [Solirubrobacterales bacterium]
MPVARMERTIGGARRPLAVFAVVAAVVIALGAARGARQAESAALPNVVFFLTDDQTASEMAVMPNTQLLIGNQGVSFTRAYASYPLCCPARATLLSGRYMHNHGVRGNLDPLGGWSRFVPSEPSALPARIRERGYYNVHVGKYMNGYTATTVPRLYTPPGWDEWYGKVSDDHTPYFNYQMVERDGPGKRAEVVFYAANLSDYQTDAWRDKALGFLDGLTGAQRPFMLNLWFNAPHGPFTPAPRHLNGLSAARLPRLPGFNEKDISDKPAWLRKRAKRRLGKGLRRLIATERRRRYEQLLSVDEAVGRIVNDLAGRGLLDETYVIFASDNGFFRGEHRIAGGKYLPHEPSSRVPLMIRGPGIPIGVSEELVSLEDVPQTILDISGDPDPALDGRSLLPYAQNPAVRSTRPILLEGDTGPGAGHGALDPNRAENARAATARTGVAGRRGVTDLEQEPNPIASRAAASGNSAPAYRAIRTDRYLYVLYANGQSEVYDMKRDPAQLNSVATDRRYRPVRKWLLSRLVPLSACAGATCRLEIGREPGPRKGPKPKKKRG